MLMSSGPFSPAKGLGKHSSRDSGEGHEAVGGFIEAMLAIIIVTSGMVLLTLCFALIGGTVPQDHTIEEGCGELMSATLKGLDDDGDLMIDRSELDWIDVPDAGILNGYSLMLMEVGECNLTVLASGGEEYLDGERICQRQPVNIRSSPRDVDAAVLMVWGW